MAVINRILVYTPNSIGLGHLFRTSAVITGVRHWRPHLDFLVLTGSSLPQVLLKEGIEVIKLPGIMQEMDDKSTRYRPRYLSTTDIENLLALRKKIILETFHHFTPDVVMLEHKPAGLMGEASVLIEKKRAASGMVDDFALVHLSRGILGKNEIPQSIDLDSGRHGILDLYDYLYVLDDDSTAEAWRKLRDSTNTSKEKIRFLGRTVIKSRDELPPRREVLKRLGLTDRPIILASLGRHGDVLKIYRRLLSACERIGLLQSHQLVLIADPYLNSEVAPGLESMGRAPNVTVLPFLFNLVELINISELVICRAGYNTVNEILLTGVRAIIIPEHHPSGEQEIRAEKVRDNAAVLYEKNVLDGDLTKILPVVLKGKPVGCRDEFNKYEIGRRIVDDLEDWAGHR